MDSVLERDLAPERLPPPLRHRLARVDRLREIWVDQRCNRTGVERVPGRRTLLRFHARELLALSGQSATTPGLHHRVRREEEALVRMEADCHTGSWLSGHYLTDLVQALGETDEAASLPESAGQRLADSAAVRTHPIIRATHLYLSCEDILRPGGATNGTARPPVANHRLPWALASLTLLRSTYPPLVMDHRLAGAFHEAGQETSERERFFAFVALFIDLQTVAMRGELSHARHSFAHSPTHTIAPLAAALHRCVLERTRNRSAPFALVLNEFDPDARVDVTAGEISAVPERSRCDAAAARGLFHRGRECRWASLEVTAPNATLRLLLLVQDVGFPSTGVLTVSADAWLTTADRSIDVLDPACTDSVTILPTDGLDDRRSEVEEYVDDVIARAVGRFTRV